LILGGGQGGGCCVAPGCHSLGYHCVGCLLALRSFTAFELSWLQKLAWREVRQRARQRGLKGTGRSTTRRCPCFWFG
jgi:hypothetical protein